MGRGHCQASGIPSPRVGIPVAKRDKKIPVYQTEILYYKCYLCTIIWCVYHKIKGWV